MATRPPLPPFTHDTAIQKIRLAEDSWNTRDPEHDDSGNWFRSYGNENWEFNNEGVMVVRRASINDLLIKESERKYHWPLGRRPDDHPGLIDLGL